MILRVISLGALHGNMGETEEGQEVCRIVWDIYCTTARIYVDNVSMDGSNGGIHDHTLSPWTVYVASEVGWIICETYGCRRQEWRWVTLRAHCISTVDKGVPFCVSVVWASVQGL